MDKFIGGIGIFWVVAVLGFMITEFVVGFLKAWRKDMAGTTGGNYAPGGIYPIGNGSITTISANMNGGITLGGTTTTSVTVNSPMVATKTMWVGDEDVGENIKLFRFFLQSRYPEVLEEYEAIRKIKES